MSFSPLPPAISPTTAASPRGLLPNPLALLHRNPAEPKKPASLDKTIVKAAVIGAGVGSVVAVGFTTHGAFFEKVSEAMGKTALAKLSGLEKALAIGVSFIFGGTLGAIVGSLGTFMWRSIVHEWKPPAEVEAHSPSK